MMKRAIRIITIWLIACLFLSEGAAYAEETEPLSTLEGGPITAAGSTDVAQTFTSSDAMTWYVRGIQGALTEASAYAGSDPISVEHFGSLGEGDGPAPKTLILVDNSKSIGGTQANADKIKTILTRLIWNHQPMERFALKTFSDHAETIIDYTDNYDAVRLAAEGLTYIDQDTYLRNVLYDEIMNLSQDGEDDYSRIIVISDGTEDSRMGVTYEELIALLKDEVHRLPVYTIGFKFDPAIGDLDKLFSLSRQTNTPYFWVEDYEDPAAIADGINEDANRASYFTFSFPPELRTGDIRAISLGAKTSTGTYNIVHTMTLPTASIDELDAMLAQRQQLEEERSQQNKRIDELQSEFAAEPWLNTEEESETMPGMDPHPYGANPDGYATGTEPETEPESETQEPGTNAEEPLKNLAVDWNQYTQDLFRRNLRSGMLIVVAVLLLALIGLIIYGDRTRKKAKDFREMEPAAPEKEPDPDPGAVLTKRILLVDMAQPDSRYTIDLGETKILGRSRARCDIAFPDDRSMAGRQARIYFEFGKAFIENLDTVGSTSLNGNVVNGSAELVSGSVLQMGDTRLRIRYE